MTRCLNHNDFHQTLHVVIDQVGLTLTEMESKCPGPLLQKGLDRGDFWLDETDNLYYTRTKKKRRVLRHEDIQETEKKSSLKDDKQFRGICAEMKSAQLEWVKFALESVSDKSGSDARASSGPAQIKMADQELMSVLQDSFDATTRLTLEVKRKGHELMSNTSITVSGETMVKEGIKLCSNLIQPVSDIESLLYKPMNLIVYQEGVDALNKAMKPFQELEQFYLELLSLHKMYVKKGPASSARPSAD